MPVAPPSKEQCEKAFDAVDRHRSIAEAARELGMARKTLSYWYDVAHRLYGIDRRPEKRATPPSHGRIEREITEGVVIAGSDAHYWPGQPSTAHLAFVHFCKKFRKELRMVVMNGDAMDLPRVSRHPPMGWTRMPETHEEIEAVAERLHEIEKAAKVERFWCAGNHDIRFETYLASNAPEVANVRGTRLKDHFPEWKPCWTVFINNRPGGLVIQHRFRGGMYAPQNNTMWAGRSFATGHLHSQKIMPITDLNGTRYGIDLGCMADPWAPQFEYLEGAPRNWRSGFGVFTFRGGEMLPPELVTVIEPGVVAFRGELVEVGSG